MISMVNMCKGPFFIDALHRMAADFFTLRVPACRVVPEFTRLPYDVVIAENMPQDEIWFMDKETGALRGKIINLNPL